MPIYDFGEGDMRSVYDDEGVEHPFEEVKARVSCPEFERLHVVRGIKIEWRALVADPVKTPVWTALDRIARETRDSSLGLVFHVLRHGPWIAHNLGQDKCLPLVVRHVIPSGSVDVRDMHIIPLDVFVKERKKDRKEK